jgi:hypothetical protein
VQPHRHNPNGTQRDKYYSVFLAVLKSGSVVRGSGKSKLVLSHNHNDSDANKGNKLQHRI